MAKKKINIADILILLVVIALIGAAVYKFGAVNKEETAGISEAAQQRTYTAYIDEVRMATVNALHEGDLIFDEKTGVCLGTIKEVTHEPFMKNVLQNDGVIRQVEFPDYYSVTLTIEGPVIEKEDGYFAEGIVELKANSEMNVITKYAKPTMQIIGISK